MVLKLYFKYFDWLFFTAVVLLTMVGLTMIYSTGLDTVTSGLWIRQIIALGVGAVGMFYISRLDYHIYKKNSNIFYFLAVGLLVAVFLFGNDIRGSTRWFDFSFFNFQPSEFSKLALIIILAKFFDKNGELLKKFRFVFWSLALVAVPAGLVFIEPDFGSSAVHLAIWFGLLLVSPMPRVFFLYLLIVFIVLGSVFWFWIFQDYQKDRINSFLDPTYDPLGRGYNVIQSIVAVGSGGLFGQGLARGLQSQLKFLPERQTDFIFASTVEELGLVGGVLVLVLLIFILFRLVRIVQSARDPFGTYLAAGMFFLVLSQSIVNIGMNIGLVPATGITLPFMSYGGSSLVIMFWLVGILQNIVRHSSAIRFG